MSQVFIIYITLSLNYFLRMNDNSTGEKSSIPVLFSAGIIAAIFILMGFLPENGWWGINHLYFFPAGIRISLVFVIILFLSPALRMIKPVGRLMEEPSRKFPRLIPHLLLIVISALFILLRVSVHTLGDGYQRASEIESGFVLKSTEMLDFLIHAVLYRALQLFGSFRATTAMAAASIIAGLIFVFLLIRQSLFSGWRKFLLGLSVLTLGSSQLFFGYVESYTLVYLFSIWYLFLLFRSRELEAPLWKVTIVYLLAGFSHVIGLVLLPSYLLFVWRRFNNRPKRILRATVFLLISLTPVLIPKLLATFTFMGETREFTDYFLPWGGAAYSVLSSAHLFDILNQFLLVAPVLLMLLVASREVFSTREYRLRVLTVIIPSLGFILLVDPELSMARDWDLFALPVSLCAFAFIIPVLASIKEFNGKVFMRLTSATLIAGIITTSWIALNHDRDIHLARAEYILDQSVKGQRYGYEMLAYYYSINGDYENELRILQAINPIDRTAPIYGKMAQVLYLLGRTDEAYRYAQIGANMPDPDRLNAIMAGLTAFDRAEYPAAIYYFDIAADLTNDPHWRCKLGDAYMMVDSLNNAEAAYGRAMSRNPNLPCAYIGLAGLFYRKGDYEKAERYCTEGLRRDPNSAAGQELLSRIINRK